MSPESGRDLGHGEERHRWNLQLVVLSNYRISRFGDGTESDGATADRYSPYGGPPKRHDWAWRHQRDPGRRSAHAKGSAGTSANLEWAAIRPADRRRRRDVLAGAMQDGVDEGWIHRLPGPQLRRASPERCVVSRADRSLRRVLSSERSHVPCPDGGADGVGFHRQIAATTGEERSADRRTSGRRVRYLRRAALSPTTTARGSTGSTR
jgi:hypothetical protein